MGYARAGFEVVGVDIRPQPYYPFRFLLGDALTACRDWGAEYDAIHASPVCQGHSTMTNVSRARGNIKVYDNQIPLLRALLVATGRPWSIENVVGAPLDSPITLCGSMFGLAVRRHRGFELSWVGAPPAPCTCRQRKNTAVYGKRPGDRLPDGVHRARDLQEGQAAMGIDWMPWQPLTQAIPPAYTEYVGQQLLRVL